MFNPLRIKLRNRLQSIINYSPEKCQEWLDIGISLNEITSLTQPRKFNFESSITDDIEKLLDLGGIISGGAALAVLTQEFETKDVDFYFNDEVSFIKAYSLIHSNPRIDVCMYFDDPCELHDMSIVKVNYSRSGFDIKSDCMKSLESNISNIYNGSVIYPDRTINRLIKYNKRLGTKYNKQTVVMFCALYNIPKETTIDLLKLSV